MNLKISVITPTLNAVDYIEQAILNVLNQKYDNFEHVIVDGGSSDETVEVLKKYPHVIWVSEPDRGQTHAMNKGFKMSDGDVIVYLNADDYFLPNAFHAVMPSFQNGAKMVVGNILIEKEVGTSFLNDSRVDHLSILRHWELNAYPYNPVGYFYRREVYETVNGFNENNYMQDLEFLLDASLKFKITKIDTLLGVYRDFETTITQRSQKRKDYWSNKNFSFISKYIDQLPKEVKKQYLIERKLGYAGQRKVQKWKHYERIQHQVGLNQSPTFRQRLLYKFRLMLYFPEKQKYVILKCKNNYCRKMKEIIKDFIKNIPQIKEIISERDNLRVEIDTYNKFVPPGHFYSPIPAMEDILKNANRIWNENKSVIPGIELNTEEQFVLLEEFETYYNELPFKDIKTDSMRYFYINPAYSYSDAIFLYCMIRYTKPKNIIEVGSGYSSCVSLDTNELFFDNSIKLYFIEPYPELLRSLIKDSDNTLIEIYKSNLQDIPIDLFKKLEKNDILFIDSTHVSKIDSDVNYIIHEILPILSEGVYVHFHDIFYPFEYPKHWLMEGRFWSEQYILRAFLQFNSHFKIVLFNTYLEHFYREKLEKNFPLIFYNTGGSIWIKKI